MHDNGGLFDVDSVRRLEAKAREALGPDVLMERAGEAAWRALVGHWPQAHRITVVCGPGGNGGDGFVLARHAVQAGRDVRLLVSRAGRSSDPDSMRARERFLAAGGGVVDWVPGALADAGVVVDGLLGLGLVGSPRENERSIIEAMNAAPAPVLALDVPSGLGPATGDGEAVVADATVEFLLPKAWLRTGRALDHAGILHLAALDVDAGLRASIAPVARYIDRGNLGDWLRPRARDSHKGSHGRVLCVGGDLGSAGAILMCAEAALRVGAGLVRVHTREPHAGPLHARLPEAMASTGDQPDWRWPDVVAIGPGLGQTPWGQGLLQGALGADRPLVLDADALNLLAGSGGRVPATAVITPHPGEAARLLGRDATAVQADRLDAACRLAGRYGCAVVLKGAGTVVAAPGEAPVVIAAGNPGMATGGTGDVLTGVVAALLGQGLAPFDAACCGALLHGCAGDVAAAAGERGMLPTDLMPALRMLANP